MLNVKKAGNRKKMIRDFSGLIGQGKFREKLCFIGGETDRVKHSHENLSWCLLCLVLVNSLVDNQKDMIYSLNRYFLKNSNTKKIQKKLNLVGQNILYKTYNVHVT